jgi:nucleoside-diphosphate-sugar epimerase
MRVLVIGGTLFIGRAMVEKLLARGDESRSCIAARARRSAIACARSAATGTT